MSWLDLLFHITEILGTIAFAISGAMVACKKRMDLFGVLFLGGVTALGGGTIRDVLLGHFPPNMFYSFKFLLIVILAYRYHEKYVANEERMNQINNILDAIGLAAFVVTGTQAAISAGYADNPFLCIFLGTTTGVGGGVLRDIMCQETPAILRKHVYAVAAIIGGLVYYLMCHFGLESTLATASSMMVTVVIRLLATKFRWSLPKIPG